MRTLGYEPYSLPLAEAPAFLKDSIEAWAQMIREAGITASSERIAGFVAAVEQRAQAFAIGRIAQPHAERAS